MSKYVKSSVIPPSPTKQPPSQVEGIITTYGKQIMEYIRKQTDKPISGDNSISNAQLSDIINNQNLLNKLKLQEVFDKETWSKIVAELLKEKNRIRLEEKEPKYITKLKDDIVKLENTIEEKKKEYETKEQKLNWVVEANKNLLNKIEEYEKQEKTSIASEIINEAIEKVSKPSTEVQTEPVYIEEYEKEEFKSPEVVFENPKELRNAILEQIRIRTPLKKVPETGTIRKYKEDLNNLKKMTLRLKSKVEKQEEELKEKEKIIERQGEITQQLIKNFDEKEERLSVVASLLETQKNQLNKEIASVILDEIIEDVSKPSADIQEVVDNLITNVEKLSKPSSSVQVEPSKEIATEIVNEVINNIEKQQRKLEKTRRRERERERVEQLEQQLLEQEPISRENLQEQARLRRMEELRPSMMVGSGLIGTLIGAGIAVPATYLIGRKIANVFEKSGEEK